MTLVNASKFLSLVLRHKPEEIGVVLDEHGRASVQELLQKFPASYGLTEPLLWKIVATDAKRRYSMSEDGAYIWANQGHSIDVDVPVEIAEPPIWLWHGTSAQVLASIVREGLKPMSRTMVHLSRDKYMALAVGARHGSPVVLCVDADKMYQDGFVFKLAVNGVWLTDRVPPEYLSWHGCRQVMEESSDGQ